MPRQSLTIRVVGARLPGSSCGPYRDVRVGLQVRKDYVGLIEGDALQAEWEAEVTAPPTGGDACALRGPAIHGRADERFLYLAWVARDASGRDEMFRRAKLQLDGVPANLVDEALQRGTPLVAELELTDACGMPLCASVRPPVVRWSVAGERA